MKIIYFNDMNDMQFTLMQGYYFGIRLFPLPPYDTQYFDRSAFFFLSECCALLINPIYFLILVIVFSFHDMFLVGIDLIDALFT